MGWPDFSLSKMFGAVGNFFGGGGPTVQPINPDTSAGAPPALATPGGPVGGSGVTPPAGAAPAAPAAGGPSLNVPNLGTVSGLPTSINIPGMGQVAMPKQTAFDNPWLQAALSAYFAGAGSPRSRGFGGALAEAGKAGIGAYQQARTQQWAPYKTLAELQHAGAETQLAGAQAKKTELESEKIAGTWEANKGTAAAMRAYAAHLPDGLDKESILDSASQLEKNKYEYVKLDEAMGMATKLADMRHTEAQTAHEQAQTVTEQQRPEEVKAQTAAERAAATEHYAAADRDRAAAALDVVKKNQAPQELINQTTQAAAAWAKATDPADKAQKLAALQTSIDKETNWFGSFFTTAGQRAAYNDQRMKDLGVSAEGPFMPGAKLVPLPSKGGKTIPGWRYDPNDPTGRTAIDPDGVSHYQPQ